ncbi:hypothetical protein QQ045_029350 [Rhodiola kirilowii]
MIYRSCRSSFIGYVDAHTCEKCCDFKRMLYTYMNEITKLGDAQIEGLSAPVSAFHFCSTCSSLIVGNESVLVWLYKLVDCSDENIVHLILEDKWYDFLPIHKRGFLSGRRWTIVEGGSSSRRSARRQGLRFGPNFRSPLSMWVGFGRICVNFGWNHVCFGV